MQTHIVMIKGKFIRVKSYNEFTLVEHPAKATLYSKKKDAIKRCQMLGQGEVATVEIFYSVLELEKLDHDSSTK